MGSILPLQPQLWMIYYQSPPTATRYIMSPMTLSSRIWLMKEKMHYLSVNLQRWVDLEALSKLHACQA